MKKSIEQVLANAVEGLSYRSETDAEFEALHWPFKGELTPKKLRELGGHEPDEKTSERSPTQLFEGLTREEPWHGDDEKAVAQKYRNLVQVLQDNLKEIKLVRVGSIEVTIYILGRTPNGDWAGLRTFAVET